MISKSAIIVASFGTSYKNAFKAGILPLETAIMDKFPTCKVVRAYTSSRIRIKLKETCNIRIDSPAEAIERLMRSGYTDIIVQPTLIIPGNEYDKLVSTVREYAGISKDIRVSLGKPLLHDDIDIDEMVDCVIRKTERLESTCAVLLVGHGTKHYSNSIYYRLLSSFRKANKKIYFAVVENEPSFADAVDELVLNEVKNVYVKPFMLVAGDHVINDIVSDSPDSLRSMLNSHGIECECNPEGIGGCEEVHNIFFRHIEELFADMISL